jgi:hypothetical protein
VPGAVANLRFTGDATLEWDAESNAVEYHVYRGLLSSLGYDDFGPCRDDLDGDPTDELLVDLSQPAPGQGFFYLVTAESAAGEEGSAGLATCVERSTFAPCP